MLFIIPCLRLFTMLHKYTVSLRYVNYFSNPAANCHGYFWIMIAVVMMVMEKSVNGVDEGVKYCNGLFDSSFTCHQFCLMFHYAGNPVLVSRWECDGGQKLRLLTGKVSFVSKCSMLFSYIFSFFILFLLDIFHVWFHFFFSYLGKRFNMDKNV